VIHDVVSCRSDNRQNKAQRKGSIVVRTCPNQKIIL